jgi:hypothetical protein
LLGVPDGLGWGVFDSLSQYPHWFVVACAAVAAASLLWVLLKLIKAAFWILLVGVLIVAGATAAWLFFR